MPKTESIKKSIAKWDKENMSTLTCRVTKEKKLKFKQACSALETNPNAEFLKTVNFVIAKAEKRDTE